MFTGIVEETSVVERIKPATKSIELTVRVNLSAGFERGLEPDQRLLPDGGEAGGAEQI